MMVSLLFSVSLVAASAQSIEVPLVVGEFFDHASVDKTGTISGASTEIINAFTVYAKAHWAELLGSIGSVAPAENQQMCLIAVAESLPPKQYLNFLNKLCEMKQQRQLADKAFERAVLGITPRKQLFLAFNWTDGEVRKVVKRIKQLLPEDHEFQPLLGDILSGAVCEPLNFATKQGVRMPDLIQVSPMPLVITIGAAVCLALVFLFRRFHPFPHFTN